MLEIDILVLLKFFNMAYCTATDYPYWYAFCHRALILLKPALKNQTKTKNPTKINKQQTKTTHKLKSR